MKYTCTDYRKEMMLLSLRLRLKNENLSEKEREALLAEIRKLEHAMEMD
jgi:hypothetical protein